MYGMGDSFDLKGRVRACNYITVAQLFLRDNFLLTRPLEFSDVKARLLGHWGTCPGINQVYAALVNHYSIVNAETEELVKRFEFILGPGHGFPALQANLFYDGDLLAVDSKATRDLDGLSYVCRNFSWPGGFPSHASPMTPGVICEGGELGYSLGTAYGSVLGQPGKLAVVLMGDGEFETGTALSSMNLVKLFRSEANGKVLPILHLNGYKISAGTVAARKSERELNELIRGFGYTPITVGAEAEEVVAALDVADELFEDGAAPFLIYRSEKGATGPTEVNGVKIAGNYMAHQIPLPLAGSDEKELRMLEDWLKSYNFAELFDAEKGFEL